MCSGPEEPPSLTTTPDISRRMSKQRRRDTQVELAVRAELHRRGFRYRIHRRPLPTLRREADILFSRAKVAVFVDGCFWHGCPEHRTHPATNAAYWSDKIEGNIARDLDTTAALEAAGWTVLRFWQHEDPVEAAGVIARTVRAPRLRADQNRLK